MSRLTSIRIFFASASALDLGRGEVAALRVTSRLPARNQVRDEM